MLEVNWPALLCFGSKLHNSKQAFIPFKKHSSCKSNFNLNLSRYLKDKLNKPRFKCFKRYSILPTWSLDYIFDVIMLLPLKCFWNKPYHLDSVVLHVEQVKKKTYLKRRDEEVPVDEADFKVASFLSLVTNQLTLNLASQKTDQVPARASNPDWNVHLLTWFSGIDDLGKRPTRHLSNDHVKGWWYLMPLYFTEQKRKKT